jgi:hypothetical protein
MVVKNIVTSDILHILFVPSLTVTSLFPLNMLFTSIWWQYNIQIHPSVLISLLCTVMFIMVFLSSPHLASNSRVLRLILTGTCVYTWASAMGNRAYKCSTPFNSHHQIYVPRSSNELWTPRGGSLVRTPILMVCAITVARNAALRMDVTYTFN